MKRITLTAILLLTLLPTAADAQKSWEKKPYQEWNQAEVFRVLHDSPWAQTAFETTRTTYQFPGESYSATIRLRSALPIRQALVRQRQLAVRYDKLSNADKNRFDAQTKEFLECSDCARYYIVTVAAFITKDDTPMPLLGRSVPGTVGIDISVPLRKLTLEDLKPYVHLTNETGEGRPLVGYIPPADVGKDAMFIFTRFDDQGKPLISARNKRLNFAIDSKVFKDLNSYLKKFTFYVPRLVQNGQVLF